MSGIKLPIFLGNQMERAVTTADAAIENVDKRLDRLKRIQRKLRNLFFSGKFAVRYFYCPIDLERS
jgi:hypothetical protein